MDCFIRLVVALVTMLASCHDSWRGNDQIIIYL